MAVYYAYDGGESQPSTLITIGRVFNNAEAEAASGLSKEDRRDLRALAEVLCQELQPMPEGVQAFVCEHLRPAFGAQLCNMVCTDDCARQM